MNLLDEFLKLPTKDMSRRDKFIHAVLSKIIPIYEREQLDTRNTIPCDKLVLYIMDIVAAGNIHTKISLRIEDNKIYTPIQEDRVLLNRMYMNLDHLNIVDL